MLTPFHIAVQVSDIEEARDFYGRKLGFREGRRAALWMDFDMLGHQFVVHLNPRLGPHGQVTHLFNLVDGEQVPVPHCGVVLEFSACEALAERLRSVIDGFIIEPHIRFKGKTGEQATMFFMDPSGNALEFKAFRDPSDLFKKPRPDPGCR